MAKRSIKSKAETKPEAAKSDVVKVEIPIWKYFQLKDPNIHEYTRAYLSEQFRDILKVDIDWARELEKYTRRGE